ncbi:hypothetical protein REPUB_Repub15cG0046600 [Reevesia pubescens]
MEADLILWKKYNIHVSGNNVASPLKSFAELTLVEKICIWLLLLDIVLLNSLLRTDKIDFKSWDIQLDKHLSRAWSRDGDISTMTKKEERGIDLAKLDIKQVIAHGTFGTVYHGIYDSQDVGGEKSREQIADAEARLDITNTIVTSVKATNGDGISATDFVNRLHNDFAKHCELGSSTR